MLAVAAVLFVAVVGVEVVPGAAVAVAAAAAVAVVVERVARLLAAAFVFEGDDDVDCVCGVLWLISATPVGEISASFAFAVLGDATTTGSKPCEEVD